MVLVMVYLVEVAVAAPWDMKADLKFILGSGLDQYNSGGYMDFAVATAI